MMALQGFFGGPLYTFGEATLLAKVSSFGSCGRLTMCVLWLLLVSVTGTGPDTTDLHPGVAVGQIMVQTNKTLRQSPVLAVTSASAMEGFSDSGGARINAEKVNRKDSSPK